MYLALAQSSQQGVSLGTALFLLGILGLIFALRRTLMKLRRKKTTDGGAKMEVTKARRALIDGVELVNHHHKMQSAVRFDRHSRELTTGQREYLMRIDEWQSQHRGGGADG